MNFGRQGSVSCFVSFKFSFVPPLRCKQSKLGARRLRATRTRAHKCKKTRLRRRNTAVLELRQFKYKHCTQSEHTFWDKDQAPGTHAPCANVVFGRSPSETIVFWGASSKSVSFLPGRGARRWHQVMWCWCGVDWASVCWLQERAASMRQVCSFGDSSR